MAGHDDCRRSEGQEGQQWEDVRSWGKAEERWGKGWVHPPVSSFGTTCSVACESCKWLPLRQVNADNV